MILYKIIIYNMNNNIFNFYLNKYLYYCLRSLYNTIESIVLPF